MKARAADAYYASREPDLFSHAELGRFHTTKRPLIATEVEAAKQVAPKLSEHRVRVLRAIVQAENGLTDFEAARVTGLHRAAARRCDLRDRGLVEDAGITRPSGVGGNATVWRATAKGYAALMGIDK